MPKMEVKYGVRIFTDFLLLIVVALPILLFFLLAEPVKRGFNCNDESLRYPYLDSTISTGALYVIGTFLPLFSMFICEWWRIRNENVGKPITCCGRELNRWVWATYSTVGTFLFGCACSQLLTDIAKYSVGRLRPHFIDLCKPDWSKIECEDEQGNNIYVEDPHCQQDNAYRLKDARLSFPSGHASFSAFTMIYLAIYLHARFKLQNPRLVRPFCQFICIAITFYTCVSRIHDYKHHWSDVLSGFILGTTVAICIARFVSDLFPEPRSLPTYKYQQAVPLQEYGGTNGPNDHAAGNA